MSASKLLTYISQNDILDRISFQDVNSIPKIILSIATIRSGTTASLRVYSEVGIHSFAQPMKSIFRFLAKGKSNKDCDWLIPKEDVIYVKETFGPFNLEEATLNPIETLFYLFHNLLKNKVNTEHLTTETLALMKKKVHLIVMGRNPFDSWFSNKETYVKFMKGVEENEKWYYEVTLEELLYYHLIAFRQVQKVATFAEYLGIPISYYVAEANKEPVKAINNLFTRIGIKTKPSLNNWTSKSIVGGQNSKVKITIDHAPQKRAGLFEKVNLSNGLKYNRGKGVLLPQNEIQIIQSSGVTVLHKKWKANTEMDLDINL